MEAEIAEREAHEAYVGGRLSECVERLNELSTAVLSSGGLLQLNEAAFALNRLLVEAKAGAAVDPQRLMEVYQPGDAHSPTQLYGAVAVAVTRFHASQYKLALEAATRAKVLLQVNQQDNEVMIYFVALLLHEIYLASNQLEIEPTHDVPNKNQGVHDILRDCETFKFFYASRSAEWPRIVEQIDLNVERAALLFHLPRAGAAQPAQGAAQEWRWALCAAHRALLFGSAREAFARLQTAADAYPRDRSLPAHGDCATLIMGNATGCVYGSRLHKPALALHHFRLAAAAVAAADASPRRGMLRCPTPWRFALLSNIALSLLQAGEPVKAFDCFLAVMQVQNLNPRLWLRLAECCTANYQNGGQRTAPPFDTDEHVRSLIKEIVGECAFRKLILRTDYNRAAQGFDEQPFGGSGAIPLLSMEFAALCARNALALLPPIDPATLDAAAAVASGRSTADVSLAAAAMHVVIGAPISVAEQHRLRCSTLCLAAYVALCIGEMRGALRYATRLLEQRHLSSAHSMLGRLYMAEAAALSDRVADAVRVLDAHAMDFSLGIPELWPASDEFLPRFAPWYLGEGAAARTVVHCNAAVAYALDGQTLRSSELLKQLHSDSGGTTGIPAEALMLIIYLQQLAGSTDYLQTRTQKHAADLQRR